MNDSILGKMVYIKDEIELNDIKKKLKEIDFERKNISTKEERMVYDFKTQDEVNGLMALIRNGIVLEDVPYREQIIDNLFSFFGKYGVSREKIVTSIDELEFFVSDIELGYGGKLVQTCNRMGIDVSYVKFLENGLFSGFKDGIDDFFIHTFTHEFLHKLSSKEDGKDVVVLDDPIVEGYTDMFAHLVSGKTDVVSDLYSFPEKICMLFSEMMGIEKTVDDYLYHNQTHPNLHNLFLECGCEDFNLFKNSLSRVINTTISEKKEGKTSDFALDEKNECLAFIRDRILILYCQNNNDKASSIITKFNELFEGSGYSFSMEDIQSHGSKK